jgi:hypothetical protein
VQELSTACANTHLENGEIGVVSVAEVVEDSTPMDYSHDSFDFGGHNSPKKIRLDNSLTSSSGSTTTTTTTTTTPNTTIAHADDETDKPKIITDADSAQSTNTTKHSNRRLIHDTDDDEHTDSSANSPFADYDNYTGDNDGDYDADSPPTPPVTTTTSNRRIASPRKRYLERLQQGRPRRASSFAFGDVSLVSLPQPSI